MVGGGGRRGEGRSRVRNDNKKGNVLNKRQEKTKLAEAASEWPSLAAPA